MKNTITEFQYLTESLGELNDIEQHLWDEIAGPSCWDSIESIVRQLETAACLNGSWAGMIYTQDILDKLADSSWCDAINAAVEEYGDSVGEPLDVPSLEAMVTFAVDWYAYNLANKLRNLNRVATVTCAVDSLDTSPDVLAFGCEQAAIEWAEEEMIRRVEHIVAHSPYPIAASDVIALHAQELALLKISPESL
tara:strand:- start:15448 stop:16029 length:582 start_codon:yes stop_codon:yes gene_type:complete